MPKRTLILWRHAKSDWNSPAEEDFERTLAERGRCDAPAMAAFITARLPRPDLILCSPARRTRETLEALTEALAAQPGVSPPPVKFPESIYESAPENLMAQVQSAQNAETVLMLGHNPGMHVLALTLADGGAGSDHDALMRLAEQFPTAACAALETETEWKNLRPGGARLVMFTAPADL